MPLHIHPSNKIMFYYVAKYHIQLCVCVYVFGFLCLFMEPRKTFKRIQKGNNKIDFFNGEKSKVK